MQFITSVTRFVCVSDPIHWSQYESSSLFWSCGHHGKMGGPLGKIHTISVCG